MEYRTEYRIDKYYGSCNYEHAEDCYGEYVHIYNLFIYPEYRRKGNATEMLKLAIEDIKKMGWDGKIKIVATPEKCDISKQKLSRFYKSLGLQVCEYYI